MATKEIAPLRVWLLALVILAILAAMVATLVVVLDDPFAFLACYRGCGITWWAAPTGSFRLPCHG